MLSDLKLAASVFVGHHEANAGIWNFRHENVSDRKISVWNVFWNIINGFMKNNKAENYKMLLLKNYLKKLQNYEL